MANLPVKDGLEADVYLKATGAGSDVDPYIVQHLETNSASIKTAVELLDDVIIADDAAFTPGTTKVLMVGATLDDSAPDSVNEGDAGALRMSANRNLYVALRDGSGGERGLGIFAEDAAHTTADTGVMLLAVRQDTPGNLSGTDGDYEPLQVSAGRLWVSSSVTALVPGTGATNLGKAIDSAAGATDTGVAILAVRDDSLSALTPAEGDYVPLRVSSTGALHVTGAGGTQYAEDSAHVSGDLGNLSLAVRSDSTGSLVDTTGDYAPLQVDSNGLLKVNVVSGGGVGGTAMTDDGAFTAGTTSFTPAGGTYRSVRDSVDDNDAGVFAMTATRALYVSLESPAGDSLVNDTLDAVKVSLIDPVFADDAAFTPGTSKVVVFGATLDDTAPDSVDEGDAGALRMTADRALHSSIRDSAGNNRGANVDASNRLKVWVDSITAGETHIGQVGSPADVITVTPSISSGMIYASGDCVGGKQTLTSASRVSGGKVVLESITILDLGNQKAALTILFFDSDPSAATITDNSAFAWSTDTSKFIGKINVSADDYETVGGEAIASLRGLGLLLKASGSADLYAAVLTTGTPTYTSSGDLIFKYGFLQG